MADSVKELKKKKLLEQLRKKGAPETAEDGRAAGKVGTLPLETEDEEDTEKKEPPKRTMVIGVRG